MIGRDQINRWKLSKMYFKSRIDDEKAKLIINYGCYIHTILKKFKNVEKIWRKDLTMIKLYRSHFSKRLPILFGLTKSTLIERGTKVWFWASLKYTPILSNLSPDSFPAKWQWQVHNVQAPYAGSWREFSKNNGKQPNLLTVKFAVGQNSMLPCDILPKLKSICRKM